VFKQYGKATTDYQELYEISEETIKDLRAEHEKEKEEWMERENCLLKEIEALKLEPEMKRKKPYLNELEDRVGGLLENYQANGPVDIGDTEETEDYVEQVHPRIEPPQDFDDSLLPRSPRRFV
jgi:hypothetical protein